MSKHCRMPADSGTNVILMHPKRNNVFVLACTQSSRVPGRPGVRKFHTILFRTSLSLHAVSVALLLRPQIKKRFPGGFSIQYFRDDAIRPMRRACFLLSVSEHSPTTASVRACRGSLFGKSASLLSRSSVGFSHRFSRQGHTCVGFWFRMRAGKRRSNLELGI